jgi:DNA-binding transcriptional ArsR family regulator
MDKSEVSAMSPMVPDVDKCDSTVIHEDIVKEVRLNMPDEESLMDLADLFKVFGDSTRVKILCALSLSEMCVCDIAALLGMTNSAISHQLRVLKQSKLIKNRRDGKVVYYSLDDEHVNNIFSQGLSHVSE